MEGKVEIKVVVNNEDEKVLNDISSSSNEKDLKEYEEKLGY